MNEDHKINDLVEYCAQFAVNRQFELLAGFPLKPIDKTTDRTLKEAGLINTSVFQRLL